MHEYVCANLNPKPNIIWNMYLRKQTGLHGLYECPLMCESSTRHSQMNIKSIMSVPEMGNEIYVCVVGASEICKQTERERFGNFEIPFETRGRCELGDDIMSIFPAALLPCFPSSFLYLFPSFSLSSPLHISLNLKLANTTKFHHSLTLSVSL